MTEQSFENHSRYVPGYHYVALPILIINVFVAGFAAAQNGMTKMSIWNFVVALALVLLAWQTRSMPLTAQNRVIRLEERMRLREKLPPHLRERAEEIRHQQLVGLRFASDEEVGELAEKCLNGELKTSKEIKRAIKTWRPDHLRV